MNDIQPKIIPSTYHGIDFRSKLEAQWAYYFDMCRVGWVYEMEGFKLGGNDYYCPDFKLIELNYWVEIKPYINRAFNNNGVDDSFRRLVKLVNQSKIPGLHLAGSIPFIKEGLDFTEMGSFCHWYCIRPGYEIKNGLCDEHINVCLPEVETYNREFNFLFNVPFLTRARKAYFKYGQVVDDIINRKGYHK